MSVFSHGLWLASSLFNYSFEHEMLTLRLHLNQMTVKLNWTWIPSAHIHSLIIPSGSHILHTSSVTTECLYLSQTDESATKNFPSSHSYMPPSAVTWQEYASAELPSGQSDAALFELIWLETTSEFFIPFLKCFGFITQGQRRSSIDGTVTPECKKELISCNCHVINNLQSWCYDKDLYGINKVLY